MKRKTITRSIVTLAAVVHLAAAGLYATGCASAGIALRESFGIAKREQLVDRVTDARDSQEAAKTQFKSTLDEFMSVTGQSGTTSELESRYRKLSAAYEKSDAKAKAVQSRIADVQLVADKLFAEWQ